MDAHIVAREIGLLRSFAQNSLQRGSKVHSLVVELVQRLENDTQPGSDSAGSYRLQVRVNQSSLPSTTLFVDKSTTIQQLKVAIESSYSGGMTLGRLLVPRTGRTWSQFSGGMTLEKCEIIDGDIVLVDVAAAASIQQSQVPSTTVLSQSQAESGSPSVLATGLERISVSSISAPIESPFFMLVLAVHCFLLDEQFVCVAEQENAVPGFAAPVREVPRSVLVPQNWAEDPQSTTLLYKNKERPGKQFIFKAIVAGDSTVSISLSPKGAGPGIAPHAVDICITEHINSVDQASVVQLGSATVLKSVYKNVKVLQARVQSLAYDLLPSLQARNQQDQRQEGTGSSITSSAGSGASEKMETSSPEMEVPCKGGETVYRSATAVRAAAAAAELEQRGSQSAPPVASQPPVRAARPHPAAADPFNVGGADLNPFSTGGIHIGPGSGGLAGGPLGPMPGSGSLVGPDHPMFDPSLYEGDGGSAGMGSGGGVFGPPEYLPQPRFDPYGPVTGPNRGVDVGNVGVDSRGRPVPMGPIGGPAGRGRGRGGRGQHPPHAFPGEPNPDHFKPPGW